MQLGVEAAAGEQFPVGADVGDAAAVHHHDAVGVADRRQAVGDDQGGAPRGEAVERLLDQRLGAGVEGGGGLVQEQHRRVAEHGAGDGDALALAAGEVGAARAGEAVEAGGELVGELGDGGFAGRGLDLGVGGVEAAEADVLADGLVEEGGVLADQREMGAERAEVEVARVGAADGDAARLRLDQAGQEVEDGALAGARGADEGGGLARLRGEAEAVEDRKLAVVEAHVLERDVAVARRGEAGAGGAVDDHGAAVEELVEAFEAGAGVLDRAGDVGEPPQRVEDQRHGGEEAHELAHRLGARGDLLAAVEQHGEEAQRGEQVDQRG